MRAKILVFGEKCSGKTQLTRKLVNPNASFKFTFDLTKVPVKHSIQSGITTLDIWDISDVDSMGNSFYGGAEAAIFCIDLSKHLEEVQIDAWIKKIREITNHSDQQIPLILAGTKSDIERQISDEQFEQLTANQNYGFKMGFKTSSLNYKNINNLKVKLCEIVGELNDKSKSYQHNHSLFKPDDLTTSSAIKKMGWEMSWLEIGILTCIPVVGWAILFIYLVYKTCCSDKGYSFTN